MFFVLFCYLNYFKRKPQKPAYIVEIVFYYNTINKDVTMVMIHCMGQHGYMVGYSGNLSQSIN